MKNINTFFRDFLRDEVNLNPTRIKVAKKGIKTMKGFLSQNLLFQENFRSLIPQGSYRQKTIIRPYSDSSDFDVDLLFLVYPFPDWEPKDYLHNLHKEFKKTLRYQKLVDRRGKSRCVTIDYASDFHIDIVPAIETKEGYCIMNKNDNQYEDTDGDGYANWFEAKNRITGNNHLIKIVRLVKYLRDSKVTFSIKSILLTSLLGRQVYESDSNRQDFFYKNIPTSLSILFNRLDTYLQQYPYLNDEILINPILQEEKFNRHWDEKKYLNFRAKIHDYNVWIQDAYKENNVNEAVKKWRKIFGDAFGEIQPLSLSHSEVRSDSKNYQEEFIDDLHNLNLGNDYDLKIVVSPLPQYNNFYDKDQSLLFHVDHQNSDLPPDVNFKWKVKNSGSEAKLNYDLRGKIEDNNSDHKIETTCYKGKHYVECYAIHDQIVIATDFIYINII